jgi:hypothetical protein
VAFILGAVICGVAVDRNGPSWVLYVGSPASCLLVPLALLLPGGRGAAIATPASTRRSASRPADAPNRSCCS